MDAIQRRYPTLISMLMNFKNIVCGTQVYRGIGLLLFTDCQRQTGGIRLMMMRVLDGNMEAGLTARTGTNIVDFDFIFTMSDKFYLGSCKHGNINSQIKVNKI